MAEQSANTEGGTATDRNCAANGKWTEPLEQNWGASPLGPRNPGRETLNPDLLSPPRTDHGALPNLRFAFADAHMKMYEGGWAREITERELPIARTIAGAATAAGLAVAKARRS
jgi:oxalate decarboxylase